jgi:hypothetical protein
MSENTKSAWGNGDEAEKAAAEIKLEAGVETELKKNEAPPRNFAEMLRAMAKAGREGLEEAKLTQEQKLAILEDVSKLYFTPAETRFKPGDLVTPMARSIYDGHGEPHVVLETRRRTDGEGAVDTSIHPGSDRVKVGGVSYGQRLDLRVAAIDDDAGKLVAHWVESFVFEPWIAKAA